MEISAIIDLLEYGFVGFAVILILLTFFCWKLNKKSLPGKYVKSDLHFWGNDLDFLNNQFYCFVDWSGGAGGDSFRTDADAKLPILDELEEQKQIIYPYRSDDDAWEFIDENEAKILKLKICGQFGRRNWENYRSNWIDCEKKWSSGGNVQSLDSISLTMAASHHQTEKVRKSSKIKLI